VIWLVKDVKASAGNDALSWSVVVCWLLNPLPWVDVAHFGFFDVLVGLACVAAVHAQVKGRDVLSGACVGGGVLLKFLPIVILPFLLFGDRRFRTRLLAGCAVVVFSGFLVSSLFWGTSTFSPLTFASTRSPLLSIYEILGSVDSPMHPAWLSTDLGWLEKPLFLISGLVLFAWCLVNRTGAALSAALAVLVVLLFYRVGYANYQMVPFMLISYWAISDWGELRNSIFIKALLISYFGWLAVMDVGFPIVRRLVEDQSAYSLLHFMYFMKFILGVALLASLIRFSGRCRTFVVMFCAAMRAT
jgi:uncharacterized membrane protein